MDRIRKKLDVGLDKVIAAEPQAGRLRRSCRTGGAGARQGQPRAPRHRPPADGYHLLDSLVVFPALGDLVEAEPAAGLSLAIDGAFARDLGAGADNLVLRAALLLRRPGRGRRAPPDDVSPGRERHRRRLRRRRRGPPAARPPLAGAAAGPARDPPPRRRPAGLPRRPPCRMRGIGETLAPLALPPSGWCWPTPACRSPPPRSSPASPAATTRRSQHRRPCPTPQRSRPSSPPSATTSNPRRRAARRPIAEARAALAAQPGCRLARMSGSGTTGFGLFAAGPQALAAAAALHPRPPWLWVSAPLIWVMAEARRSGYRAAVAL